MTTLGRLTSTPKASFKSSPSEELISSELFNPLNARRLSHLAMPSPVSTPGAEHLSDVSSCCSVDDLTLDSNRSSPLGSPASSSFSLPASDIRKKYKNELWSAIRSDYRYLMDEEIIETCKSTESDLSLESDDQGTSATVSCKDYLQQYNELNSWLTSMLKKMQNQSASLSDKYLNQTFHEEMLNRLMRLKHFKEYARRLMESCPRLKEDIKQHLKQVNSQWEALEKLILPNSKSCDAKTMMQDMDSDLRELRQWVTNMDVRIQKWKLRSTWTTDDIIKQLTNHQELHPYIESHSRIASAVLSLCERMASNDGNRPLDEKNVISEHRKAIQFQATQLQRQCHAIWLRSLEWQMTLENAKANGIHLRHDVEDDQWDRSKFINQRKQKNEFPELLKNGSNFLNGEDFHASHGAMTNGELENMDEDENIGDVSEESFGSDDRYMLDTSENQHLDFWMDGIERSFSEPVLNSIPNDSRMFVQKSHSRSPEIGDDVKSNLMNNVDLSDGEVPTGKLDLDDRCSRELSPGLLKRSHAIDLMAAFGEKEETSTTKTEPVDVGYSSGCHSNEDTDNSSRQELGISSEKSDFIVKAPGVSSIPVCEKKNSFGMHLTIGDGKASAVRRPKASRDICTSIDLTPINHGRVDLEAHSLVSGVDSVDSIATTTSSVGICENQVEDLGNIPETEDELSSELPLDEVPVTLSPVPNVEEASCVPPWKRFSGSSKASFRRSLHFADEASTSDCDTQSLPKFSVLKTSPKKKFGRGDVCQVIMSKGRLACDDKMNEVHTKKKTKLSSISNLAGSYYASSEGTESESELAKEVLKASQKVKCRGNSKREGSQSLRSSPVKNMVDFAGRSSLKRRICDNKWRHMDQTHRWMSDSAICQNYSEDFILPKIRKVSSHFSDTEIFDSLKALATSLKSDDVMSTKKKRNPPQVTRLNSIRANSYKLTDYDAAEQIVPTTLEDLSQLQRDDIFVPSYDSLTSSLTELTQDDFQMLSDYEKNGEEMLWQEDSFYLDGFGKSSIEEDDLRSHDQSPYFTGFTSSHILGTLRHKWMDSDSDVEDFQHVLQESHKGLKFIELTIHQGCGLSENGNFNQDPYVFNEPLATCETNISCLQELIDALKSKNKMDNEIQQVNEIISRWKHLRNNLILLQKEADRSSGLLSEVIGLQMELKNNSDEIEFKKFDNVKQLEQALKALKNVQYQVTHRIAEKLENLEMMWNQCESNQDLLDSQSIVVAEKIEQLKKSCNILQQKCETDGYRFQSALFSWYKFTETEDELSSLLMLRRQSGDILVQTAGVETIGSELHETINDLELRQDDWMLLDEKLQLLGSTYLDFVDLCSDSCKMALKETMMVPCSQLKLIRKTNDEKIMKLVKAKQQQLPSSVSEQKCIYSDATVIDQIETVSTKENMPDGSLLAVNGPAVIVTQGSLKYILPMALALVLFGGIFCVFGDKWCELFDSFGLLLDPILLHVRGPPPS